MKKITHVQETQVVSCGLETLKMHLDKGALYLATDKWTVHNLDDFIDCLREMKRLAIEEPSGTTTTAKSHTLRPATLSPHEFARIQQLYDSESDYPPVDKVLSLLRNLNPIAWSRVKNHISSVSLMSAIRDMARDH